MLFRQGRVNQSRRDFLRRLAGMGLAATGLSALGGVAGCGVLPGSAPRVPRIGYLSAGLSEPSPVYDALRQGLRELGYVEGQNIALEPRWAEGDERLSDLANELVDLEVDVIIASGTQGAQAARDATSTIPIVFIAGSDAVRSGLVPSLAHPGGNTTGLSFLAPELSAKRLELLKESIPGLARVGALYFPANSGATMALRVAEKAAPALALQLQTLEVKTATDFELAFASAVARGAGAILSFTAPLALAHRTELIDLAARNRLPAMYDRREFVEAGGLMAYGPSLRELYRTAATYVDRILKGTKPAALPVERPTQFDLIINLRTAEALGLKIPESLRLEASELIQ